MAFNYLVVPSLELIKERLEQIFPDGTPKRADLIADRAARTVQVMFYAGAIEGCDIWVRPSQITRMSDEQVSRQSVNDRADWYSQSVSNKFPKSENAWYADNTRESVRDDTLRHGLVEVGAVVVRDNIKPTSSLPRYALQRDFSALFDISLTNEEAEKGIERWRNAFLSKAAIIKSAVKKSHARRGLQSAVEVSLPGNERRFLSPGESSEICKAVIEHFAPMYLVEPALLLLSESGNKLIWRDAGLCSKVGLSIDVAGSLPDIILADLSPPHGGSLIVFVEAVHSDGPVSERRKRELTALAVEGGFSKGDLAFLTAFTDRRSKAFAKVREAVAWDSFVWFASEPQNLVIFRDGATFPVKLGSLLSS